MDLPGKGLQFGERESRVDPFRLLCKVPHFLGNLILFFPPPRTTALLLSVSHLVLVTRNACHLTGGLDWIDQSLSAAEEHLEVLREAALASEPDKSLPGPEGFLQEQSAI
jgi:DNA-binding transcriptional ArsR family regulator